MRTISFETLKKLKDVGFPQREDLLISAQDCAQLGSRVKDLTYRDTGYHVTFDFSVYPENVNDPISEWDGKTVASVYMSQQYLESLEGKERTVYVPTLRELIEACGDGFNRLVRISAGDGGVIFQAQGGIDNYEVAQYRTLEEAVAKLYLALHGKTH